MNPVKALILAGGLSSRMGSDKSELLINGERLIENLIHLVKSADLEVRISCRQDQISKLSLFGDCIVDQYHQIGPMGGLLSAFNIEKDTAWLVIGCDMPNVDLVHIKDIIAKRDESADATCFINSSNQFEPLFCIWEESSCPGIKEAFKKMDYSLTNVLHSMKRKEISTLDSDTFININTPEDLNDYLL